MPFFYFFFGIKSSERLIFKNETSNWFLGSIQVNNDRPWSCRWGHWGDRQSVIIVISRGNAGELLNELPDNHGTVPHTNNLGLSLFFTPSVTHTLSLSLSHELTETTHRGTHTVTGEYCLDLKPQNPKHPQRTIRVSIVSFFFFVSAPPPSPYASSLTNNLPLVLIYSTPRWSTCFPFYHFVLASFLLAVLLDCALC